MRILLYDNVLWKENPPNSPPINVDCRSKFGKPRTIFGSTLRSGVRGEVHKIIGYAVDVEPLRSAHDSSNFQITSTFNQQRFQSVSVV